MYDLALHLLRAVERISCALRLRASRAGVAGLTRTTQRAVAAELAAQPTGVGRVTSGPHEKRTDSCSNGCP
eukprot:6213340-Pleurochrysis_carterae.AAC.2